MLINLLTTCIWMLLLISHSMIVFARHKESLDTNIKSQFATKTTYDHRLPIEESLPWTKENIPSHLEPILIDATLRHGTRFPSDKRVKIFKNVTAKFQDIISKSLDINIPSELKDSILAWENQFPDHSSYLLSSLGWDEQIRLGHKYFSMVPKLWQEVLARNSKQSGENFMVMSSRKVRVLATAKAFLNAIVHANSNETSSDHHSIQYKEEKVLLVNNQKDDNNCVTYGNISVKIEDTLLRFFDECKKYVHTVDKNETAEHEFENYFKSVHMSKLLHLISDNDSKKEVYHIYQLCAFEMAVYGSSVWCQLFDDEQISILEYASDLKHYYKTGHGYAVNVEQSCILLQNVTDRIAQRKDGKMQATLRFGHAETLIPLVGLLGFYQEAKPLQAHNYGAHVYRTFRTGKISPFSGNLAIVLYESVLDKNIFISFVLNENIIKPFGLDCYFCDFSKDSIAYKKIHEKLEDCHRVCDLEHQKYAESNTKDEL